MAARRWQCALQHPPFCRRRAAQPQPPMLPCLCPACLPSACLIVPLCESCVPGGVYAIWSEEGGPPASLPAADRPPGHGGSCAAPPPQRELTPNLLLISRPPTTTGRPASVCRDQAGSSSGGASGGIPVQRASPSLGVHLPARRISALGIRSARAVCGRRKRQWCGCFAILPG